MNKRGQGISMEFIIIAAIALIVLIVIILFFTGGIQKLTGGQKEFISGTIPDWQRQAWTSRCKLSCTGGNSKDYCDNVFTVDTDGDGKDDAGYTCSETNFKLLESPSEKVQLRKGGLGVECTGIKCSDYPKA